MTDSEDYLRKVKVVNDMFHRVMDKTGGVIALSHLTNMERCVVLVFHVLGLALCNGLDAMLEDEMDDDPGYRLTIQAFRQIGAGEMAEIIEEGLRLKKTQQGEIPMRTPDPLGPLDDAFFEREKSCVIKLARFIERKGISN